MCTCSLAVRGFISTQDLVTAGGCVAVTEQGSGQYAWFAELLPPPCPLFGRKFPAPTAEPMLKLDTEGEAAEQLHRVAGLSPAPDESPA